MNVASKWPHSLILPQPRQGHSSGASARWISNIIEPELNGKSQLKAIKSQSNQSNITYNLGVRLRSIGSIIDPVRLRLSGESGPVKGTTLFLVKRSHLLYYHLKLTSPKFKHPQNCPDLAMLKYNFWCWLFFDFLEMKATCFDLFPETVRLCLSRLANQNGNLLHLSEYRYLI